MGYSKCKGRHQLSMCTSWGNRERGPQESFNDATAHHGIVSVALESTSSSLMLQEWGTLHEFLNPPFCVTCLLHDNGCNSAGWLATICNSTSSMTSAPDSACSGFWCGCQKIDHYILYSHTIYCGHHQLMYRQLPVLVGDQFTSRWKGPQSAKKKQKKNKKDKEGSKLGPPADSHCMCLKHKCIDKNTG